MLHVYCTLCGAATEVNSQGRCHAGHTVSFAHAAPPPSRRTAAAAATTPGIGAQPRPAPSRTAIADDLRTVVLDEPRTVVLDDTPVVRPAPGPGTTIDAYNFTARGSRPADAPVPDGRPARAGLLRRR